MTHIKKYSILVFAGILALLMLTAACSSKSSTTTTTTTLQPQPRRLLQPLFRLYPRPGRLFFQPVVPVAMGLTGRVEPVPHLWGSGATLGTYKGNTIFNNNAQDMLTFVSTKMPLSAPGSLTHQQYIEVLSYILVQGNQVSGFYHFQRKPIKQHYSEIGS